jgi:recombination protein RecA
LYLKDNPKLAIEIENLIRGKYNLPLTKTAIKEEVVKKEDVVKKEE